MNHLHDWRYYAQEKEPEPAPSPRLAELLNAMHSRMGATRPGEELDRVVVGAADDEKPIAQMGWDEYRQRF